MQFPCTIAELSDGRWSVAHAGPIAGEVRVVADSRDEALRKMKRELHYRLELCPCTGETYRDVEIEIVAGGGGRQP
ncbi:MAG: hypothetical protein KY476_06970 [Planctomycetes bacterium]|nr:hypothetical protein [Planctomycetota bacterium]